MCAAISSVVADASYVRIFVFGLNKRLAEADLQGAAKKTMDAFSSSQTRFQRHVLDVQHRFAKEVADRVLFLDQGVIAEQGSARELLSNPRNARTQDFLKRVLHPI